MLACMQVARHAGGACIHTVQEDTHARSAVSQQNEHQAVQRLDSTFCWWPKWHVLWSCHISARHLPPTGKSWAIEEQPTRTLSEATNRCHRSKTVWDNEMGMSRTSGMGKKPRSTNGVC